MQFAIAFSEEASICAKKASDAEELATGIHRCVFKTPFDNQGALYWLATGSPVSDNQKKPYQNPHSSGEVVATMSSVYRGDPMLLVQHWGDDGLATAPNEETKVDPFILGSINRGEMVTNCTENVKKSWISVDLGPDRTLVPKHYCLRHGTGDKDGRLKNWQLQASNDAMKWTTLQSHTKDKSFPETGWAVGDWPVEECEAPYRYFRILQNGMNSDCINILCCAGIELYGNLRGERAVAIQTEAAQRTPNNVLSKEAAELVMVGGVAALQGHGIEVIFEHDGEMTWERGKITQVTADQICVQYVNAIALADAVEKAAAAAAAAAADAGSAAQAEEEDDEDDEDEDDEDDEDEDEEDAANITRIMTSNIGKYQLGQPITTTQVSGFLVGIAANEPGATAGPGVLAVSPNKPKQPAPVTRIGTSNIAKYQLGQCIKNAQVDGFVVSITASTPGASNGQGILEVSAEKPKDKKRRRRKKKKKKKKPREAPRFDPETGQPLGAVQKEAAAEAPRFDPETGKLLAPVEKEPPAAAVRVACQFDPETGEKVVLHWHRRFVMMNYGLRKPPIPALAGAKGDEGLAAYHWRLSN
jgi:hypothetical protein